MLVINFSNDQLSEVLSGIRRMTENDCTRNVSACELSSQLWHNWGRLKYSMIKKRGKQAIG